MDGSYKIGDLVEATEEQKLEYLSKVSHGFTRGLYSGVRPSELPLYTNGCDFYILTIVKNGVVSHHV